MKLKAEHEGESHDLDVRRDGGRLFARVGDREYEIEVSEPEPGVFLFKHDGRVFEAYPSGGQVRIGGQSFEINIIDPKRLRDSASGADHGHGHAEIKTAMPGKIVRLLVAEGDNVEAGTGVVVVEAMKMQNEMRSPRNGIVKAVAVTEGDAVTAGQLLAVIE